MKQKTHSGAKKRMRVKPGGKIKHGQCSMRHLLSKHSSKKKRRLGKMVHMDECYQYQADRLLVL